MKPTIDLATQDEISSRYKNGANMRQISESMNLGDKIVRNALKRSKTPRRSRHETSTKFKFNEKAFDELTDDSAYWIGFLMADGTIRARPLEHTFNISVTLEASDKGHLEKLKAFLNLDRPLYVRPPIRWRGIKEQAELQFNSEYTVNALAFYGVVPNKSLIASPAPILLNNNHFWRGLVDGDGHINISRQKLPIIHLSGSHDVVHGFCEFGKTISNTSISPRPIKGIFQAALHGQNAVPVIRCLYLGATTYLDRKMDKAMKILDLVCPTCGTWMGKNPSWPHAEDIYNKIWKTDGIE